jgi:hypothetical protein
MYGPSYYVDCRARLALTDCAGATASPVPLLRCTNALHAEPRCYRTYTEPALPSLTLWVPLLAPSSGRGRSYQQARNSNMPQPYPSHDSTAPDPDTCTSNKLYRRLYQPQALHATHGQCLALTALWWCCHLPSPRHVRHQQHQRGQQASPNVNHMTAATPLTLCTPWALRAWLALLRARRKERATQLI